MCIVSRIYLTLLAVTTNSLDRNAWLSESPIRKGTSVRVDRAWPSYCVGMTDEDLSAPPEVTSWQRVLDKPQSGLMCVSSWILSSAIFIGAVALFGGPSMADASESLYATWAIAHGKIACAYPPAGSVPESSFFPFYQHQPAGPPLWPLISGGYGAVTRIGHTVPFPSQHALGTNCADGYWAMYGWAQNTAAIFPTIGTGYLSWFVLLAGVVALLRASGRGRAGWECFRCHLPRGDSAALGTHCADVPPPRLDVARACSRRHGLRPARQVGVGGHTRRAGSHLATIRAAGPDASTSWWLPEGSEGDCSPARRRRCWSSRSRSSQRHRVERSMPCSSERATPGHSVARSCREPRLHGAALVFCSRVLPIVVSLALAFWASRRLGSGVVAPLPLTSLLATSLSLRIVFEEGLFG